MSRGSDVVIAAAVRKAAARFTGLLAAAALLSGTGACNRSEPPAQVDNSAAQEKRAEAPPPAPPPPQDDKPQVWSKGRALDVYATWYDVPEKSLAKRRAAADELTAAHNRLPLGTLVRVTHLKNGKTVHVRITDRGIRSQRVKLDLCKEAAEELGMVRKGLARVRMQVLEEEGGGGSAAQSRTAAANP